MNYLRDRLALTTAGLAILTCGTVDTACSAEASAQTGTVVVAGPSLDVNFSAEELARLPLVKVRVSMGTMRGTFSGSFEGPLLWTILENAGAVDPKEPRKQAGEAVLVTGRDGYTAVFGAGEIAPEFEGKQIVLAERVDGKPLEPDHLRIVVPGDRRGGRSVRDVVHRGRAGVVAGEVTSRDAYLRGGRIEVLAACRWAKMSLRSRSSARYS